MADSKVISGCDLPDMPPALDSAELQKLDPRMQTPKIPQPESSQASSSMASGLAWADNERREKEASQARIAAGPRLAASKAQTNVHKVRVVLNIFFPSTETFVSCI